MARDYVRDHEGRFADNAGTSTQKPADKPDKPDKPQRSTAQKVAIGIGVAVGVAAVASGAKVRHDTLARYDARTAAALLRASDVTSSWP